MRKTLIIMSLLLLTSCSIGKYKINITDTSETPIELESPGQTEQLPFIVEDSSVVEVSSYNELDTKNDTDRLRVKNGLTLDKQEIDAIVTKCKYFEGEQSYVFEGGEKVEYPPFSLESFLYDGVENGYCPGTETKKEKKAMVDLLVQKQLPEKFKQFANIDSFDEINIESLNLDLTKENYKQEILLFISLYMYTLGDDEQEKFDKFLNMYNELVTTLYEDYSTASEEYYYPILITLAAKNNDCSSYINKYLISY